MKIRKKQVISFWAVLVAIAAQAAAAETSDTALPLTETRIVEQVTGAVDKALAYIADKQRPDGGWHDNNAPNALAMLAFMGRGHVPGRGPYR